MNKEQIERRIETLMQERTSLEHFHYQLVMKKTRDDQVFQQQVVQNQNRFAQIQGAMAELKALAMQQENNHADPQLNDLLRVTTSTKERTIP